MQSSTLKAAQPPFNAGMVRAFTTIVSAFALVVGLAAVLVLVSPQSGSRALSPAAAEQALVDFREGEREMLITRLEAAAAEQALVDFRRGEREPLTPVGVTGDAGTGSGPATVDPERARPRWGGR